MSSCKYLSLLHIQDENQFNNIHIIYRNERGMRQTEQPCLTTKYGELSGDKNVAFSSIRLILHCIRKLQRLIDWLVFNANFGSISAIS
jgi:hypothetical protein